MTPNLLHLIELANSYQISNCQKFQTTKKAPSSVVCIFSLFPKVLNFSFIHQFDDGPSCVPSMEWSCYLEGSKGSRDCRQATSQVRWEQKWLLNGFSSYTALSFSKHFIIKSQLIIINKKTKSYPASRNRTSDLGISVSPLQSLALPAELSREIIERTLTNT